MSQVSEYFFNTTVVYYRLEVKNLRHYKDIKMKRTAAELTTNIQTLISMPHVYLKVKQLINSPQSGINDFADVVQYDPGLSARILRIVNSSFFGFPNTIETLNHAINLLGIADLHDLVLANSAIQAFSKLPIEILNKLDFWRDSIHTAVLCRLLAQQCSVLESDRLFVAGLLHQLGYLIICAEEPEKTLVIIEQAKSQNVPRYIIEREIFGFDYAQVGGELLRQWKLPASFQETVAFHLEPDQAIEYPLETTIVHLAQKIVAQINDARTGVKSTLNIAPQILQLLNIDEQQIEAIKEESKPHLVESMKLFLTNPVRDAA